MQFDERLKVLEERERAVAEREDADGREGLAEQAATTVQLRDAVERQERRIDELERTVESERYRREVAESVLEDPSLAHNLAVEIERLQSALSDRERELEEIAAARRGGRRGRDGRRRAARSRDELEGKIAVYEIELLELRARLEDVVDREFADLREGELKQEIERLGALLAAARRSAGGGRADRAAARRAGGARRARERVAAGARGDACRAGGAARGSGRRRAS